MLPRYSCATSATVSSSAKWLDLGRAIRIVAARARLHDLRDDRRDVVQSASPIRLGNQRRHLALRLGARVEQLREPAVVHHAGEPVAGHEKEVTVLHLAAVDVGLY